MLNINNLVRTRRDIIEKLSKITSENVIIEKSGCSLLHLKPGQAPSSCHPRVYCLCPPRCRLFLFPCGRRRHCLSLSLSAAVHSRDLIERRFISRRLPCPPAMLPMAPLTSMPPSCPLNASFPDPNSLTP